MATGVSGRARRGIVTNIDNDALKNNFAIYVKYLPNRDHGPNLHPVQALASLKTKVAVGSTSQAP